MRCGVVWCGLVWCIMLCDVVLCSVVRYGRCGVAWRGVECTARHEAISAAFLGIVGASDQSHELGHDVPVVVRWAESMLGTPWIGRGEGWGREMCSGHMG